MAWTIAFRVDASVEIGSGHVMRCLTLAGTLAEQGAEVTFVCRDHPGHLGTVIQSRGFQLLLLSRCAAEPDTWHGNPAGDSPHAGWLGVDHETDARQCIDVLRPFRIDLLVVDHYALDARWEARLRPHVDHIMVIDDLADRIHDCDVLLDQNLGRQPGDYDGRVPFDCLLLVGPSHALLRPEFARLRESSLARRGGGTIRRVLVSMGGVDLPNATGRVLQTLGTCPEAAGLEVLVVMGAGAPWLSSIEAQVRELPFRAEVRVAIGDMAAQICASDLSIGAAGGTAWERCCLGMPTILVVLAENQRPGAMALERAGAAFVIESAEKINSELPAFLSRLAVQENLFHMQSAASRVTDGQGARRVIESLETILA